MIQNKKTFNKVRSDYSRKSFNNPFYYREKKTHWFWRFWKFSLSGVAVILIALTWFIFFSPVFAVADWRINGLGRLSEEQIKQVVSQTSSRKNIFSYPDDKLKNNLLDKYNLIEVEINKNIFKKRISITIKERTIAFVYSEAGKHYFVDKDAYLVEEIMPGPDGVVALDNSYPLIENTVDAKIKGKKIDLQDFSFSVFSNIKERLSGEGLLKFVIDNNLYSLRADLSNGCYLVLSLENDLNKQLDAYFTFKNGRLPGTSTQVDISKLKKVDLRDTAREAGDKRIYYELK